MRRAMNVLVYVLPMLMCSMMRTVLADVYIEQLFQHLMMDYNKSVRPVKNASDALLVKFGANLCRLIDVDEVNQVLTTSLWLEIQWTDSKLVWNPDDWGSIKKIHIPSDQIWIPDILLYNNADGEPHISIISSAMVDYKGTVIWMPPSTYKSLCPINIQYFPYDVQQCYLKFGGWSHDGQLLDLQPIPPTMGDVMETRVDANGIEFQYLELGMGLSFYHESAEWDLLSATSSRYAQIYPGCCGQQYYVDIRYTIIIRRKALFFTVIIVIPCMLIANLTIFVFWIPPREHKITFSNSVFVALSFYYLILIELIPPTSLVIPLLGKYLLFTLFMVCASMLISVVNVNIYRRQGTFYMMPEWMRWLFVRTLPRYLCLKMLDAPYESSTSTSVDQSSSTVEQESTAGSSFKNDLPMIRKYTLPSLNLPVSPRMRLLSLSEVQVTEQKLLSAEKGAHMQLFRDMAANVAVIAANFHNTVLQDKITDEWRLMSLVIDRICLVVYFVLNMIAISLFILQAPSLFDARQPLQRTVAQKPLSGDAVSMLGS
ncbi:Acetylcholine receptor subunit alpha-type unc-38 [Toxocara canis]|uniref:Acetylcholine receptor subunit alpha-type unc-38 n=1 Tax=Toxocara canis TaxID=6265 RepID=A0A0B2V1F1_TOXCA|nr:Acetylcholine receptor subunit alpha-type unc-38 [Toxocara canis]